MNASELYAQTLAALFVDGTAENLLGTDSDGLPSTTVISNGIYPGFYQQALYDLQMAVPCYRYNHISKYPHCASYFNCGLTVIPKPQGKIVAVYTTDKINPETGLEDPEADDEHCAKVYYQFVEHCFMSRYIKLCQKADNASSAVVDDLATLLFGVYRPKSRYPRPTDEGMENLPKLPDGFHYPQVSTDAAGRSARGVFSFSGNNIWIAPWIQSTETLHVRWSGIQRRFGENDAVEDDPKFKQAVRLHMGHQHHSCYGDSAKADDFKDQLWGNLNRNIIGAIPILIDECREEMLAANCSSAGFGAGSGAARGLGAQENAFYNDTQFEFTAYCPSGKSGGPFTVVKEIGSVPSALSVADANARASQEAQNEANARLSECVTPAVTYYNTAQSYPAQCPGASGTTPAATGTPVTVTIPAGDPTYNSTVSQAAADAAALAAATSQAIAQLVCTFHNAPQSRTAECPSGTTGTEQEATIPANQSAYDSTISQADADSKAGIAAQNAAEALLVCTGGGGTYLVGNTAQPAQANGICLRCTQTRYAGGAVSCQRIVVYGNYTTPAGTYTAQATAATAGAIREQLNQQARAQAELYARQQMQQQCSLQGGSLE